jgi:hypothetical protein
MKVTLWPAARKPSPVAAPTTPEPTMKIREDSTTHLSFFGCLKLDVASDRLDEPAPGTRPGKTGVNGDAPPAIMTRRRRCVQATRNRWPDA